MKAQDAWAALPEELRLKFSQQAAEIWQAGYASGFEHGVLVWANAPTYGVICSAGQATHEPGTEAPTGEDWKEMREREIAAGAQTVHVKTHK